MTAKIHILLGDCLELLKNVPSNSVDMICCDLPYGITNCKWDTTIDLKLLWLQYKRVCKSNAAIVLFAQTPFDKVIGCSNLEMLRYEWIWEKANATGHLNAKKMPMKAHENILVFYNSLPTYNPQKTQGHVNKISLKSKDNSSIYSKQSVFTEYNSTERYPRSVLKFSSDKQTSNLHPTQKPLALTKYLIETYTNTGETVLDNCMGSGTAGVACIDLGRNFIGIEKDKDIFETAKARLKV